MSKITLLRVIQWYFTRELKLKNSGDISLVVNAYLFVVYPSIRCKHYHGYLPLISLRTRMKQPSEGTIDNGYTHFS